MTSRIARDECSNDDDQETSCRTDNLRRALAQEAARIMAEHGIRDFLVAKRKAAERLGVDGRSAVLPKNTEIEDGAGRISAAVRRRSHVEIAARAAPGRAATRCSCLREFEPRLVGPVLSGTATEHSDVQLHLFADSAEIGGHQADGRRAFRTK